MGLGDVGSRIRFGALLPKLKLDQAKPLEARSMVTSLTVGSKWKYS